MMPDDLIPYNGEKAPLKGTQGAVVQLRSGELAILPPRQTDDYDFETETLWFRAGDASDIVAFKTLPNSAADRLARTALEYLNFEETLATDPVGHHPLNRHVLAGLRRKLRDAIDEYKETWPGWPDLETLRRLRHWGDEDE